MIWRGNSANKTRMQLTASDTHTFLLTGSLFWQPCSPWFTFRMHKLRCTWLKSWRVSEITVFNDLPVILHFELCQEYIMSFILVTSPCTRSGCGRLYARHTSSGWGLRACSCRLHEQSITNPSWACSFVGVSLCYIFQCVQKLLILCSIFRQQNHY